MKRSGKRTLRMAFNALAAGISMAFFAAFTFHACVAPQLFRKVGAFELRRRLALS